jgi:Lon protease-like protein
MVADAVAEGRCVGMALLKEGWEQNYYGNPPIHGIGCVGRLVSLQQLPDGRYNILLYGLDRYEICEQFYEKSYRQATVRLKPLPSEPLQDRSLRTNLVQLLHRYMQIFESSSLSWAFLESNVDDQVFLNHVAACLEFTPVEKQFLLEANTVTQQGRRLSDLLQFKLHERDGIKGQG